MIFIFRSAPSQSARALADAVDGIRSRNATRLVQRLRPTDKVVMWGDYIGDIDVPSLNNVPARSKRSDALMLSGAGVRTVEVRETPPMIEQPAPVDPLISAWRGAHQLAGGFPEYWSNCRAYDLGPLIESLDMLRALQRRPAPTAGPSMVEDGWLPRLNNHVGGIDLLNPINPPDADFWVRRESFTKEYRVHSFLGRSIRAGVKVLRDDFNMPDSGGPVAANYASQWIRSWDGGWRVSYADGAVAQRHRDIAHAAVRALGLDFGAVDIAEKADGELVVLEVNRAPGIEAGTPIKYANAIRRWVLDLKLNDVVGDAASDEGGED